MAQERRNARTFQRNPYFPSQVLSKLQPKQNKTFFYYFQFVAQYLLDMSMEYSRRVALTFVASIIVLCVDCQCKKKLANMIQESSEYYHSISLNFHIDTFCLRQIETYI